MDAKIEYSIKLNKGPRTGEVINIITFIGDFEENGLTQILIDNDYLECYCNDNEYTILDRKIIVFLV